MAGQLQMDALRRGEMYHRRVFPDEGICMRKNAICAFEWFTYAQPHLVPTSFFCFRGNAQIKNTLSCLRSLCRKLMLIFLHLHISLCSMVGLLKKELGFVYHNAVEDTQTHVICCHPMYYGSNDLFFKQVCLYLLDELTPARIT